MEAKELRDIHESDLVPITYGDLHEVTQQAFDDGKKAGIKEVVEWVSQHGEEYQDALPELHYYGDVYWQIPLHDWQAKLKEWGMT